MKNNLIYYLIVLSMSFGITGCAAPTNTPTTISTLAQTNYPTPTLLSNPPETLTPVPTITSNIITQSPTVESGQNTSTPVVVSSKIAPTSTPSSVQLSSSPTAAASSNCTDTAGFFGDVTIPDGTSFAQNIPFVKTWAIRNEGTCSWGPNYSLVFYAGDQMSGPLSVPLSVVAPGDITNISVNLKSPPSGGAFTGLWEFQNPSGTRFGVNSGGIDQIWVKIGVSIFNNTGVIVPVGATPVPTTALVANATLNPTAIVINNNAPSTLSTASSNATSTPSNTCTPQENSDYEQQILAMINNARAQNNLNPLTLKSKLSAAAYMHSKDMACNNYVDHTGSDGSTWFTRIHAQNYAYSYASENIYVGNPDFGGSPQGAFTWWMNDQIHRDNILNTKVSEIGIGYAFYTNSSYGGYYTVDFAKP